MDRAIWTASGSLNQIPGSVSFLGRLPYELENREDLRGLGGAEGIGPLTS